MRWTWKTTIWRKLSRILWLKFIDLDEYINKKIWKTVSDFVEENSWEDFREIEHKSLKEIIEKENNIVLSLWWWAIIFPRNQKLVLKNSTKTIFIDSSLENINSRISKDLWNKNRASLTWKSLLEELEKVYNERKEIYNSFYDLKVSNNWSFDETLKEIIKKINYWNICIPIVNLENISEKINIINNDPKIKFVEIRLDLIEEKNNLESFIDQINKQIILTNRTSKEWWKFVWTSKESIKILKKYLKKVDYVDFELINSKNIEILKENLWNTKLIISYHNFLETPKLDDLKNILEEMKKYNPDVYKIAIIPKTKEDVKIIYDLEKYFQENFKNKDYIFISMWKLWMQTRINIAKQGAILSFWNLDKVSAPGQIGYSDLYNLIFNW